jgi:GST-like protein
VRRWADEVAARPAVIRGRKVNRMRGKPEEQVAERHDAADLD